MAEERVKLKLDFLRIVEDFFATGDLDAAESAVISCVQRDASQLHDLVKRALIHALHEAEEQQAVELIQHLHREKLLGESMIRMGIFRCIDVLDDLALQHSAASIAAISSELVAVGCLQVESSFLPKTSSGDRVEELLQAYISAQIRLGSGIECSEETQSPALRGRAKRELSLDELKEQMKSVVLEFLSSGDIDEALVNVSMLGCPLYMHEFVKRLLVTCMDRQMREHNLAIVLLSRLHKAEALPGEQIQLGFYRTVEAMDDLCSDMPAVATVLSKIVLCAVADGMLSSSFLEKIPTSSPGRTKPTPEQAQFRRTLHNMYQTALWTVDIGASASQTEFVAHDVPLSPRGICIAAAAATTATQSVNSLKVETSQQPSTRNTMLSPRSLRIEIERKKQRVELISMDDIRKMCSDDVIGSPTVVPYNDSVNQNIETATSMCSEVRKGAISVLEQTGKAEGQIEQMQRSSPQKLDQRQGDVMTSLQAVYDLQKRMVSLDNRVSAEYAPY